MLNFTRGCKALIYRIPLLALLLLLFFPSMHLNAASWDSNKLKPGTKVSAGDTITCKSTDSITIAYYQSNGTTPIEEITDTGKISITEKPDTLNGGTYKKYTVTEVSFSQNNMRISLTGITAPDYVLQNLMIKNPPAKTTYTEGESFDRNGMVVTACYSNNSWEDITDYTVKPSGALTPSDEYVTISYTDNNNKTVRATQNITVNAKEPDTFYISAGAAAGGTISDAGGSGVKGGNSKTYTISPYNGYRINYVEADGNNVGAVTSYTFHNVWENHSINAYFMTGSTAKKLTVVGSFANASGAGAYTPGTKVTVDAGFVPGFVFAGWTASDGIIYPMPQMSYTMPGYDILLYANWIQSGLPNAFSQITPTNLKGQQLTSWADITNKLASFSTSDLNQPGSPILKVTAGGSSCYVDAAAIAMLNTRQGIALDVSYGADASFTFYSDMDNSLFTGADFTYTCSTETTLFFHEKKLMFTHPGAINTGICLNMMLPDAQTGQTAYVYIADENGTELMYLPTVVDEEHKITIPLSVKVNLNIKY